MRRWTSLVCGFGCALALVACGDDATSATGDGGTGSDSDGTAGSDGMSGPDSVDESGDGEGGMDAGGSCSADADCVGGDPCTAGVCNGGTCEYEPSQTGECRPAIDVDYPPRGATIQGELGETVVVTGTITTGYGEIQTATFNDEPITIASDGSFSVELDPFVGGNTFVIETEDSNGWKRRRVQSFLWSSEYALPTEPMEGASQQGLLMHLGQESIDDGDRSDPINDLGSVMKLVLDGLDVGSFVDPTTPIASSAGYDIYVTSLTKGSADVSLSAIDGGLHLSASLNDIQGDLDFDCTTFGCELLGGDGTGGLAMDSVQIEADMMISAGEDHTMQVDIANVETMVNNLDIWSNNGWTNFLLTIAQPFILSGIVADVENLLTDQVHDMLGPLLAEGLAAFDISTALDFPSLSDPEASIVVMLETDIGATDFQDGVAPPDPSASQGGVIEFRGGGYPAEPNTPYDNLGIPGRVGCGVDDPTLVLPRVAPLEIGLADELLNQMLYGAWRGGLLEFTLPPSGMGSSIEVKEVELSGMLAPTANDCNEEGTLLAHVGDLQIRSTIVINGMDIDFLAYSSLAMQVDVGADDVGISLAIPGVAWMETELTVEQDEMIGMEDSLRDILEAMLETQLLDGLSGGGFGAISLPDIDLSGALGLPPGTAALTIHVEEVERMPGVTVVNGHF